MSHTEQKCIYLTLDAKDKVRGLEKLPANKMVKVEVYDEVADTRTEFEAVSRDGRVCWYIRDSNNQRIRSPGVSMLTSYTGRTFVKQLPPRAQRTFHEATIDFLNSICLDFKQLQELIDRDMGLVPTKVRSVYQTKKKKSKHGKSRDIINTREVDMWNPVVEPENRYRILKGFMQSRKTWAIISTALYYLLKYRMSTFIVVQNSLDASEQLMSRIKGVFRDYKKHMEDEKLKDQFEKLFKVLDCERGKTVSSRSLERAMNGSAPQVFIVIRNSKDITPVNNTVEKLHTHRYIVMIDESDFNDSGSKSAVQVALSTLKERAGLVYDVTATPMTSLMKEDIDTGNVVVLSKPDGYKGILTVQCFDLKKPAEYCAKVDDNPFLKDKNLKKYIRDFAKTKPHKCRSFWGKQLHPRYSLVRLGSVIKPQLKVAAWVNKCYGNKIVAITYNGSGHGVTLRGSALPEETIFLEDGTESKYTKGVHYFSNGLHVGKIIAYLQNNGGVMKYPRIMVFAGTLADRGISFGTSEWGECLRDRVYPWHLTEMYFIAAKSMSQSNLLQAAGRLCGVYPDNIPLSLYTNAGDDVYKSFGLQEELIQRAKNARVKASFHRLAKELIPELAISREKCSNRRPTAPRVGCPLRKVESDFLYGGMDWKVEGFEYDGTDAEFGNGQRVKKPKSILTEEEREAMREDVEVRRVKAIKKREQSSLDDNEYHRLLKMFPRWASNNGSKIANFMNTLDPRKEYTKKEIEGDAKNAGIRLPDCHLVPGGKRVRYGNIIQNVGNMYRLFPCLVEPFEQHFNYQE